MKDYKSISKHTFDNIAADYENTYEGWHASQLYPEVYNIVIKLSNKRILDIGCGNGNLLKKFAHLESDLYGIDFSEPMIDLAKKLLNNRVDLILSDSENLPWKENFFDVIICLDSFHHYPRPRIVLKEMKRVLKATGTIVIADPFINEWRKRQLVNFKLKFGNRGDVKLYSKNNWEQMIHKIGLRITSWKMVTQNSIILTAKI